MFKIASETTFAHTVKVMIPVDGGHQAADFRATFRVLPSDREKAFDLGTPEGSDGFLRAVFVGADDVAGDDGQALPWSDELRDRLLQVPFVRTALTRTYFRAVQKAAEGN